MDIIKLAAIKRASDGEVFTGRNHSEILYSRKNKDLMRRVNIQGFITDKNDFVDRKEAGKIALEAGQIDKPTDTLFSEDITGDNPWAGDVIKQLQAENEEYKTALETIRDLETDCCHRCEGNGRLYADGKSHLVIENAPTILCGNCGGSGRILPEDAQDIAGQALKGGK